MKELKTERLILKPYTIADAEGLYEYAKDPEVGPIAGWAPHKDVEESRKIIEELFMPEDSWAIRLKGEDRVIGSIALEFDKYRPDSNSRELGYSLGKNYWGHGIMTEAARAVIKFGFEDLSLDQIGICTSIVNKRSQRVIEKCGFTYEGTVRRAYKIYNGTFRDSMVFSMLKEEYEKKYK